MTVSFDDIAAAKYILLSTFRKDGSEVATPVWAVRDGDHILVWTVTDSYKVKRLRRDPRVKVAACDIRGTPLSEALEGTGAILDAAGTDRARKLIQKKYGVTGFLAIKGSLLRRGRGGTVGLELRLV